MNLELELEIFLSLILYHYLNYSFILFCWQIQVQGLSQERNKS
jgi:hypothetical protein